MAYTTIDKPSDYFNTVIWTGNGSQRTITVGFQPDFSWLKNRGTVDWHKLSDSVRGANKVLASNENNAEGTETQKLQSFVSTGFTIGTDGEVNGNGSSQVAWNWKAGTSVSGNTTGSGTAKSYSGSVNTDAGFSITTFTGNGTANHTLPHNLGVAPDWFIIKKRIGTGDSTARDWNVFHQSLGNTKRIALNSTGAVSTSNEYWNDTSPTSSVINLGTNDQINGDNNTYICYAFAEKKGYSKIGSYIGTGSDSFIYTGFKVGWLLVKVADGTNGWLVIDTKRSPANPQGKFVYANASSAEGTVTYGEFFSNGFGWKGTNSIAVNQSGKQYIYYAIAENPFVTSTGVPATAR